MKTVNLLNGDCLEKLKELPDDYVDLILTDPPYGYNFKGSKGFDDKNVPSVDVWKECLRVLKAGSWCLVMSSPRQDVLLEMINNLKQAGFDVGFTSIYWTYNSGFPKSKNLGQGAYSGFSPKPAVEIILVCMKFIDEKSYTEQFSKDQKGCVWFDECRIPYKNDEDSEGVKNKRNNKKEKSNTAKFVFSYKYNNSNWYKKGRFPANILVSDQVLNENSKYFDLDTWVKENNFEDKDFFDHIELSPKNIFPFMIVPKAVKYEKNKDTGLDIDANYHMTIKPLKLFHYLVTLCSRPEDIVVDPFMGSGTTGIASIRAKRNFIGIEIEKKYFDIAKKRIMAVHKRLKMVS